MTDARRTILLAIAFGASAQVAFMGMRMAIVLHAISLGAGTGTAGLLQAIFTILGALFSIRMGRVIDRVGPARPLLYGLLAVVVFSALPVALPTLPVLFVAGLGLGAAASFVYQAQICAIGELSDRQSRLGYMSLSAVVYSLASFIGPMLAGVMIDGIGHRLAPLAIVPWPLLGLVAMAVVGMKRMPGPPPQAPNAGERRALDLLREPRLRAVYILSSALTIVWESYYLVAPLYGTERGFSATTIGILMSTMSIAMLAVRLVAPVLARRITPWNLMVIALGLASTAYLVFPLTGVVPLLMILSAVIGVAVGVTQPMTMAMLYELAPKDRTGEAVGLRQTFASSGAVAIPVVFGALGSAAGMLPVFWVIAAIGYAGAVYGRRYRPRRQGSDGRG